MITYISTYITGFTDVVIAALPKGTRVLYTEDGLVVYTTSANVRTILQSPFLNNSYILVQEIAGQEPQLKIFQKLINNPQNIYKALAQLPQRPTTFRIMATVNNQLVSINPPIRETLERVISKNKLFTVNRTKPNIEFLLMTRQTGKTFFTLRLTHHENYERTLKKGELYPELTYLLCLMSEPKRDDVFLDPFCGSASISLTRAKYFPVEKVYATDTDKSATNYALLKAKKLKRRIDIFNWNALDLYNLPDQSISKIVTDPPWRLENDRYSLEVFYTDMLKEFLRILKPRGICVLLVENQQVIEKALQEYPELKIIKKLTTLVSGRKATVYKIIKL